MWKDNSLMQLEKGRKRLHLLVRVINFLSIRRSVPVVGDVGTGAIHPCSGDLPVHVSRGGSDRVHGAGEAHLLPDLHIFTGWELLQDDRFCRW